jgi:hypothetical protein
VYASEVRCGVDWECERCGYLHKNDTRKDRCFFCGHDNISPKQDADYFTRWRIACALGPGLVKVDDDGTYRVGDVESAVWRVLQERDALQRRVEKLTDKVDHAWSTEDPMWLALDRKLTQMVDKEWRKFEKAAGAINSNSAQTVYNNGFVDGLKAARGELRFGLPELRKSVEQE